MRRKERDAGRKKGHKVNKGGGFPMWLAGKGTYTAATQKFVEMDRGDKMGRECEDKRTNRQEEMVLPLSGRYPGGGGRRHGIRRESRSGGRHEGVSLWQSPPSKGVSETAGEPTNALSLSWPPVYVAAL
jgi:hypothetical protein